ncbi:MAG: flagellar basal body P-ring formation protein FlgA [Campylobacterales bacterium]|nr:flagellar basal body P-ring formation protein FlgA [Campylobacterales bacterium]
MERYEVNSSKIYSTILFPEIKDEFLVLEMPNSINSYRVRASDIVKKFEDKNISISHENLKTILFVKKIEFNSEQIKEFIANEYLKYYPTMIILDVLVDMVSINDIDDFKISVIDLKEHFYKKSSGSFAVSFKNSDGREKRLFFKYQLKAKLQLYKAKDDISHHEMLNISKVTQELSDFQELNSKPIDSSYFDKYSAKLKIKKDRVLTENLFEIKSSIEKGDLVRAVIKSGDVELSFEAVALSSGNIGDVVKIQKSDKKVLSAKVISSELVEVK